MVARVLFVSSFGGDKPGVGNDLRVPLFPWSPPHVLRSAQYPTLCKESEDDAMVGGGTATRGAGAACDALTTAFFLQQSQRLVKGDRPANRLVAERHGATHVDAIHNHSKALCPQGQACVSSTLCTQIGSPGPSCLMEASSFRLLGAGGYSKPIDTVMHVACECVPFESCWWLLSAFPYTPESCLRLGAWFGQWHVIFLVCAGSRGVLHLRRRGGARPVALVGVVGQPGGVRRHDHHHQDGLGRRGSCSERQTALC